MKADSSSLTSKLVPKYITSRLILYRRNFRVLDWRAYVGMTILGLAQNLELTALYQNIYEVLKFILTIFFYLAFSFSVNNCFDVECDSLRKEKLAKNPIAAGLIEFKESLTISLSTATLGLLLSYLWFRSCFPLYLSLVLLAGAYSMPPLRFKSVPLMDLISHGLFFGALLYLYGYGAFTSGELNSEAMLTGVSVFIYSTTLELRNHLDDLQTDACSKVRTTVCWLGYEKSKKLLEALLLLHWLFLILVSTIISDHVMTLFVVFIALVGIKWMKFDHYLRFADVCTCVAYLTLLSVN